MSKKTIGDRVRALRQQADLSQRALASKIGVSPAAIGRMESEFDYVTSRPTIIALAQLFSCDADWLEFGTGEQSLPRKKNEEVVRHDRSIKSFLDSLPKEVRSALAEHWLAGGHYLDMESLLDIALKTRAPLPNKEEEKEFQWMLRRWARRRARGRAAIFHGIEILDMLAKLLLDEHINEGAKKTTSQLP